MTEEMQTEVVGGDSQGLQDARRGKRFAAAVIDLFLVPLFLGIIFGLVLIAVPPMARNIILVLVNIGWMAIRDSFNGAGPGKRMVGIKVVKADTGEALTFANIKEGLIRNVLLYVPFILLIGGIVEIGMLGFKGFRFGDKWANTRVVDA